MSKFVLALAATVLATVPGMAQDNEARLLGVTPGTNIWSTAAGS